MTRPRRRPPPSSIAPTIRLKSGPWAAVSHHPTEGGLRRVVLRRLDDTRPAPGDTLLLRCRWPGGAQADRLVTVTHEGADPIGGAARRCLWGTITVDPAAGDWAAI